MHMRKKLFLINSDIATSIKGQNCFDPHFVVFSSGTQKRILLSGSSTLLTVDTTIILRRPFINKHRRSVGDAYCHHPNNALKINCHVPQ